MATDPSRQTSFILGDHREKLRHMPESPDKAGIAQLVEHDLAKVGVASSNLVSRSISSYANLLFKFTEQTSKLVSSVALACYSFRCSGVAGL